MKQRFFDVKRRMTQTVLEKVRLFCLAVERGMLRAQQCAVESYSAA